MKRGRDKVRFDLTAQGLFFALLCLFMAALCLYTGTSLVADGHDSVYTFGNAFMIFFGFLLFWGVWWMVRPITFNKRKGFFWKGNRVPSQNVSKNKKIKDWAFLTGIYALQIIAENCEFTNSETDEVTKYKSFELNLILKDATRVNVVDHGDYFSLEADAQKLSQFLNVPLWDVTR